MKILSSIIGWILGIFFVFIGALLLEASILTGVLWILAGLLIIPVVRKKIPKFKGKNALLVCSFICLIFAGMYVFPEAENTDLAQSETGELQDSSGDTTSYETSQTYSFEQENMEVSTTELDSEDILYSEDSKPDSENMVDKDVKVEDETEAKSEKGVFSKIYSVFFGDDSDVSEDIDSNQNSENELYKNAAIMEDIEAKLQKGVFGTVYSTYLDDQSGFDVADSTDTNAEVNEDSLSAVLSILFHQPYIDVTNIELHYVSERETIIPKIIEALQSEPVKVKWNNGGLFSNGYYDLTNKNIYSMYYGKIKDNKPDGFGVLTDRPIDLNNYSSLIWLSYAGNFSVGRYHGYGVSFEHTKNIDGFVPTSMMGDANQNLVELYLNTYVSEEGKWKKGELTGKANLFNFDLFLELPRDALDIYKYADPQLILYANAPTDYWAGAVYPTVIVTEYDNNFENGDTQIYAYNTLLYDGNMKKGEPHGKGVSYYANGQVSYEGEWKGGKYEGKGTKYDEDGNEEYSGKWDDGDYKS